MTTLPTSRRSNTTTCPAGRPGLLDLETGAPAFELDARLKKAVLSRLRYLGDGDYPEKEGSPLLREQLAVFHRTHLGMDHCAENMQITYGGMQALTNIFSTLLSPGDEVLVPAPYWYHFPRLIRDAGATPVAIETSFDNNFKLTPEQLEAAITPATRMLVFTNPNNPTGSVHEWSELQGLAEVLARHEQVLVLSDEVYNQLVFGEHGMSTVTASLACLEELSERVLVVNSFSKNYGLSGMRVGYIAAPIRFRAALTQAQRFSTLGVSPLLQEQAEAVMAAQPLIVPALMEKLWRRRELGLKLMRRFLPSWPMITPRAGYYFFADVRGLLGRTTPGGDLLTSDVDLIAYLRREAGVTLQSGTECGAPGFVRLTFAVPEQTFESGVQRLADAACKIK